MVKRVVLSVALSLGGLLSGVATSPAAVPPTPEDSGTAPAIAQQSTSYTLLYVSAQAGSDRQGDGSQRHPFQTITHALRVAQPNTVIVLAAGVYSEASGEQFPLQLRSGITVQGTPSPNLAEVVIQGNSAYNTPSQGLRNITLLGANQAGLANVTVNNPHPNGHGLWIEAGSPVILQNAFVGSGATGITVAGAGNPVIQGNFFLENGEAGLAIAGPSSAQVQGNVFENTGTGIRVAPEATPRILNNRITRNQEGLLLHADAQPVLRDNQITDNRRNSVLDYAAWSDPPTEPTLVAASTAPQVWTAPARPPATSSEAVPEAVPTAIHPTPPPLSDAPAAIAPVAIAPDIAASAQAPASTDLSTDARADRNTDPSTASSGDPSAVVAPLPPPTESPTVVVPAPVAPLETAARPNPVPASPTAAADASDAEALRQRIRASREARLATVSNDIVGEDAIAIPIIPPPASAAAPAAASAAAPAASSAPALPPVPTAPLATPSQAPQGPLSREILIVPDANIPVGNGGRAPNVRLADANTGDGPPPPPSRATSLGLYYRVFVDTNDEGTRGALRELVPDTFRVEVNGRPMMQAGAFDTLAEAQRTAEWLNANGFRAQVEYIP